MLEMRFEVNLSSWIIQDGNYSDFARGEVRHFALEFWHEGLSPVSGFCQKSFELISDSKLKVTAEVIVCEENWYAIDFGVRIYTEQPPPKGFKLGQYVTGEIQLGIDPYFYMEYLHKSPSALSLIYTWQIDRIRIETAPFITRRMRGMGKVLVRDPKRLAWKDIESTDAWNDDNGRASYLLDIKLSNPLPSFESDKH